MMQEMRDTTEVTLKGKSDYSMESLLGKRTTFTRPVVLQVSNDLQRMMQPRDERLSDYPLILPLQQENPNIGGLTATNTQRQDENVA